MAKFQAQAAFPAARPDESGARARSDAELARLLAGTAAHDQASFRALYDRTAPQLLAVALRIVRDRNVAEDVVQDAFLKVWGSAGTFDPQAGRALTWLVTVVRHRAIDVVRRRGDPLRRSEPIEDHSDTVADGPSAGERFEDADRLARCLGLVEPAHRNCFVRAYLDGYSREELAAEFGKPVNTIKTWLHRTAASLRACLGGP